MNNYHVPVLPNETIEYLKITKSGKYIDCTLGGGGHTELILAKGGNVLGIDQDIEAINYSKKRFVPEIARKSLVVEQGNFAHLNDIARATGFTAVNGILFDLGVSTHQLDTPERGFSFNTDAPLDMRKDPSSQTVTAADLIAAASEKELARIIENFGEDHAAHAIARAIVKARSGAKITTTSALAKIILSARKRTAGDRTHPATRTFQALRIVVNDEMATLTEALPQALNLLQVSGRLVVISFHSLEDRIIKNFFKDNATNLRVLTDKPISPQPDEIATNPRSRSGKLRAAEKI